jgi:hypothetical protein
MNTFLLILGLYTLHWLVHYKIFLWWCRWENEEPINKDDRKEAAKISLVPVAATLLLIVATSTTLKEKIEEKRKEKNRGKDKKKNSNYIPKFLEFVDGLGTNQIRAVKNKIESVKTEKIKKKEEKKKEKNKYDRADILDFED